MANTILGPNGQPINSSTSGATPKKEPHVLDQIMKASTDEAGQFHADQAGKGYQKFLQQAKSDYDKLGKAEKTKVGSFYQYLANPTKNASQEAMGHFANFLGQKDRAQANIESTIKRYKDRIESIGDPQTYSRKQLRESFSQKKLQEFEQQAFDNTKLKLSMMDKLKYTGRKINDKVFNFMDRKMGFDEINHSAEDFIIEKKSSRKYLNEVTKNKYDLMRKELGDRKGSLRRDVKNLNKSLEQINNYDAEAIGEAQSKSGIKNTVKAGQKEYAAKQAAKTSSKGWGWKGKAGAVAGLLALGGVIGNQFAGGHKSNAELYNPNPQPQYYS